MGGQQQQQQQYTNQQQPQQSYYAQSNNQPIPQQQSYYAQSNILNHNKKGHNSHHDLVPIKVMHHDRQLLIPPKIVNIMAVNTLEIT